MPNKSKSADRLGIIGRVTTPLGFFTLGILVIEGILGSLSIRASGVDLTILIVGILIGFAILCAMVFVLAAFPRFSNALLGVIKSPSSAIAQMNLTANDIRVIYTAYQDHGSLSPRYTSRDILGDEPLPWPQRCRKLQMHGLIKPTQGPLAGHTPGTGTLTEEGWALGVLIMQFFHAILEIEKSNSSQ